MPCVRRQFSRYLLISLLLFTSLSLPALAADKKTDTKPATKDISGGVTKSYTADPSVQIGMIVALKAKDSDTVIPLKYENIHDMLGIVVPAGDAAIVLTPQQIKAQQVLVATTGRHNVIVSNQNGPIKVGDYLTISAISGVGMKAGDGQEQIVGQAAADFSGNSGVIGSTKVTDTAGRTREVALGRIDVDLNISHNPLFQKQSDFVPGFLAKVASGIANKPVSVARIYTSMAVLLIAGILTGNMIYSGIRNGMIAVGRNPLSKKSIIKSLIQTVVAGLIVFVAGVFAVYLLLKL